MDKRYTAATRNVAPLARSKRLRQAGLSGGGSFASLSTRTGGSSFGLAEILAEIAAMYLSKQKADTAQGRISFAQGLNSNSLTSLNGNVDIAGTTDYGHSLDKGVSGGGIWKDELGNWHAQFDFLRANKKFEATEFEVEKMSHIGGAVVLSAANCKVCSVERIVAYSEYLGTETDLWRCYFVAHDDDGATIYNCWKVGDQARCQTFNLVNNSGAAANHYYWSVVQNVGTTLDGELHYIDLPATLNTSIRDTGSDDPAEGDSIVLLGSRHTDANRKHAIIIDSAGTGSPYIKMYVGIERFTMPKPRIDLNPEDPRLDVSELIITARDGSKTNVTEALESSFIIWYVEADAPRDATGEIVTSLPADYAQWPVAEGAFAAVDYTSHLSDIALTLDGVCYRFETTDGVQFAWVLKTDAYLIQALEEAAASKHTLANMASDNVITAQEKRQLVRWQYEIQAEREQICIEADSLSLDTKPYINAYNGLNAFLAYLCADTAGDTELTRADGKQLVGSRRSDINGTYSYSIAYTSTLASTSLTYDEAVTNYYAQRSTLRKMITGGIRTEVQQKFDVGYNEEIRNYILRLRSGLLQDMIDDGIDDNASIAKWDAFNSVISNWQWTWDNETKQILVNGAGLLTSANFASLFAQAFLDDEEIASAMLSVFVSAVPDENGERWVSGVNIAADKFTVNTENFKLNAEGDLELTGRITAKEITEQFCAVPDLYSLPSSTNPLTTISLSKLISGGYYKRDGNKFEVGDARNFILYGGVTITMDPYAMMDLVNDGSRILLFIRPLGDYHDGATLTSRGTIICSRESDRWTPFIGCSTGVISDNTGQDGWPSKSIGTCNRIVAGSGLIEFIAIKDTAVLNNRGVQWCLGRQSLSDIEYSYYAVD